MRARFALVLLLSACRFDGAPPVGLVIACSSDAECPMGDRCEPSVSACWPAQSDGTPPSVTTFDVPVRLATRGTALSVTLTASEALIVPPRLTFGGAGAFGTWQPVHGPTPPSYAFSYLTAGTEPEGAATLSAQLIDASGTVAAPADLGAVTFDFTAPQVLSATVAYAAGADALGPSSTAEVDVTLGEATALPPTLTGPTGAITAFWSGAVGNTQHFVVRTAAAATVQGPLTLVLHATDVAGNSGDVPLPTPLNVDTVAPPPPGTTTAGTVVYRRFPQGSSTRPAGTFEVEGAAFAVAGAGTVVVTAPSLGGLELARGPADAGGAFGPLALPAIDVAQVAVTFIDHAGNVSTTVNVQDVEWTASLGVATSGPHQLTLETVATDRWTQLEVARSLEAQGDMPLADGLALWLACMRGVEQFVDASDAAVVHVRYTQLLGDWRSVVRLIARRLDVPLAIERREDEVDRFLESGMHNHRASDAELEATIEGAQGEAIRALYGRLLERCEGISPAPPG